MYGHERSLVEDYSDRPFVLLGVNNDSKISRVKKAIKDNNLNWRSWYDGKGGPIVKSFGVRSFPSIYLIDHNGVIQHRNVRGKKLDEILDEMVSAAEADGATGGSEPGEQLREFVDRTGKFKIQAKLTDFAAGTALLTKESGKEMKVPWKKLCIEDRRYIANFHLKKTGLGKIAKQDLQFSFDEPIDFTDVTGEHTRSGTFLALSKGMAIIWDPNGREFKIKWSKLDDDTKDRIKTDMKARRVRLESANKQDAKRTDS